MDMALQEGAMLPSGFFTNELFLWTVPTYCHLVACLKLSSLFALAGSNKKDKAEWTWSGLAELVKYSRVSSYSSLFLLVVMVHLLLHIKYLSFRF